jgi:hypothetical protein
VAVVTAVDYLLRQLRGLLTLVVAEVLVDLETVMLLLVLAKQADQA